MKEQREGHCDKETQRQGDTVTRRHSGQGNTATRVIKTKIPTQRQVDRDRGTWKLRDRGGTYVLVTGLMIAYNYSGPY